MNNTLRFIITLSVLALIEYYSFVLVKSAVKQVSSTWRVAIMALYLVLSIGGWVTMFFIRSIPWEAMPSIVRALVIAIIMGLFVGKLLIAVVMLADDIRRGILYLVDNVRKPSATEELETVKGGIPRSVFLSRLALTLGAGAMMGFIYGISNRYNYKVRRVKMSFPNLPESFKGLKIVQLSDIHSGSFDNPKKVAKGIALAMAQKPDIIFFTGDLVNDRYTEVLPYASILSQLKAPMGVYSTLGNHDYGDYVEWPSPEAKMQNLQALIQQHAKMGWRLLMNEHVVFEKGADKIAVIGIENWSNKARFPKYGRMEKAYAGLKEKEVPFKILLSHDPSHWEGQVLKDYTDVDLTLSGHTHGMQFGIDIPGVKWSPVQYVYKNWMGLYEEQGQRLYVNRGFGFLGYPGRLGILPEITLIELS